MGGSGKKGGFAGRRGIACTHNHSLPPKYQVHKSLEAHAHPASSDYLHTLCFEDRSGDQVIAGRSHVVHDIDILQTDGKLQTLRRKGHTNHHVVQEVELSTLCLQAKDWEGKREVENN